jgi:hypothetical protein
MPGTFLGNHVIRILVYHRCANRLPSCSKQLYGSTTVFVPDNRFSRSTWLSSAHTIVSREVYRLAHLPNCGTTREHSVDGSFGASQESEGSIGTPFSHTESESAHFLPHFPYCLCSLILAVLFPGILTSRQITGLGPEWIKSGCARYIHSGTAKKLVDIPVMTYVYTYIPGLFIPFCYP